MIVGIDPSYTSTGIAIVSDDLKTIYHMSHFSCEHKIYDNRGYAKGARVITSKVYDILIEQSEAHPSESIHVVIEYPVLGANSAGSFLMFLSGYLDNLLETAALPIEDYIFVPPTLCNSVTKNKERTKTHISDWALDHYETGKKRINNDIATALVFCWTYPMIMNKEYTKVFFRYKR